MTSSHSKIWLMALKTNKKRKQRQIPEYITTSTGDDDSENNVYIID